MKLQIKKTWKKELITYFLFEVLLLFYLYFIVNNISVTTHIYAYPSFCLVESIFLMMLYPNKLFSFSKQKKKTYITVLLYIFILTLQQIAFFIVGCHEIRLIVFIFIFIRSFLVATAEERGRYILFSYLTEKTNNKYISAIVSLAVFILSHKDFQKRYLGLLFFGIPATIGFSIYPNLLLNIGFHTIWNIVADYAAIP